MKHSPHHYWRDAVGVLLLASFSMGFGIWVQRPCIQRAMIAGKVAHPTVSLETFSQYVLGGNVLILDARNQEAFLEGHVPGAVSLPVDEFDRAYRTLAPILARYQDKLVVVYCADMWCGQADALQQKLINVGFEHVGRYSDGWGGWVKAGFSVEKNVR